MQPPFGYHPFSRFFNSVPADLYKYRVAEFNPQTKQWVIPEHRIPPGSVYINFFDQEHYRELTALGLLTQRGDIDQRKLGLIQIALDRPFDNAYRHNVYYQRRNEARAAVQEDHEAYFGTNFTGDIMGLWDSPEDNLPPHSSLMAATLPTVQEEPFPFNSPIITAADGTPLPNNYMPTSPQALLDPVPTGSATIAHQPIPSDSSAANLQDLDITMGATTEDFLTKFVV
ncbi:hypothetical protein C0993_009291 [Termitomyces sp. T159_Od127]|nr:hypothetical protein C0993_009291 [Termitomyces sp. T159_Od127]